MCGIAGILHTDGSSVLEGELSALTEALRHRGPDDSGIHLKGPVGLGHRRLAIIDLEGGLQPLANEDGTVWVTFNGEIYNFLELAKHLTAKGHRFKTRSDTEVLVHAYEEWGEGCLEHLRGMFAFAIWDSRQERLFLARDRLGIKPLCFMIKPGRVTFASELQAFRSLKAFHPALNLKALDLYLHFQYIPAPFTIYNEIQKLMPAHYLIVERDGRVIGPRRYWDLTFQPNHRRSEKQWIELLGAALLEAIQIHLVSDVPFGAFLSGGVDSSTVVAYMNQALKQPVRTFTIGYDESKFDERVYAREVAEILGTEHYEEIVQLDSLQLLPTLVKHYGEPFGDDSALCTYHVARIASRQVKMALSGDGGDEVFAGYRYYGKILRKHRKPEGMIPSLRESLFNLLGTAGFRPLPPSPRETWYGRSAYIGEELRGKLWHPQYRYLMEHTRAWNDQQFEPVKHADLLSQCQYVDIHNYLPYNNLYKVDIASMCHGLEVRVPLLDHIFLELAATIPPEMKLRSAKDPSQDFPSAPHGSFISKYIFKKIAEQFFYSDFLNRRKRGFSVPVTEWFAGPYHRELKRRLKGSSKRLGALFDMEFVEELIDKHLSVRGQGLRLWTLLFLAEWMEQNSYSI